MMNAKVKKRWVAALRSGTYKQGTGQLKDVTNDTFCCLGVLCELYVKEKKGRYFNAYDFSLPLKVTRYAGLEFGNPIVKFKKKEWCLSDLNDCKEVSFKKIARLIEKQL